MAKQNGTTRPPQSRTSATARSRGSSTRDGAGNPSVKPQQRKRAAAPSRGGQRPAGSDRKSQAQREQVSKRSHNPTTRHGIVAGAGAKAVDAVVANPIPAALIGAGLTWLLVTHRQRLPRPHVPGAISDLADAARESFHDASQSTREVVGSAAESVRDGAAVVSEYAQNGASAVSEYAQSGATKAGRVARKGFEKSRNAVATTWDEYPLTVGVSLLAAGVAAGMLLPAPKGAAVARAAKGLTDRVASTGEDLLDNARELLTSSTRAVAREAKRQGLTPTEIGRKAKRVAAAVTP